MRRSNGVDCNSTKTVNKCSVNMIPKCVFVAVATKERSSKEYISSNTL